MQLPLIDFVAGRAAVGARASVLALWLMGGALSPAVAESAYIDQTRTPSPGIRSGQINAGSAFLAGPQYGPRSMVFIPTPETAPPSGANGNVAQTLQAGSLNRVFQAQTGQSNFSSVGIIGGKGNDVGVLQGGHDLSNLDLINTRGLFVGVIQPNGSAPVNMLIARLPDGRLLIKR